MLAALLGSLAFVLALAALLYSRGFANAGWIDQSHEATPSAYASLARRRSHQYRYYAEVTATTALELGVRQRWTVRLTHRNGLRVSGAQVVATAWMPETGARATVQPRVSYAGEGHYIVDDLTFSRPGWWNLALVIDGNGGPDSVAFNVLLRSSTRR